MLIPIKFICVSYFYGSLMKVEPDSLDAIQVKAT